VTRMLDMAEDQAFFLPVTIDDTSEITARVPDRFRERHGSVCLAVVHLRNSVQPSRACSTGAERPGHPCNNP
jgi:hypothetical protein